MNRDEDRQLDDLIEYLRNEPVPEMPAELTGRPELQPSFRLAPWAVAVVLAASVLLMLPRFDPSRSDASRSDSGGKGANRADGDQMQTVDEPLVFESEVVVLPVDLSDSMTDLEIRLDLVDEEVAELRLKASLLDARRLADQLLVQQ